MGTKTTTTSSQDNTTKFDPQSKARYDQWSNSLLPTLQSLFNNPTGSSFFNSNLQGYTKAASALSGRSIANSLLNYQRSGLGGSGMGGGLKQSLLNSAGRYGSQMQYQGFQNAMGQAQMDRWNAGQLGSALFQPLTTGSKSTGQQTQQTSGLGTWLPQVLGAAVGGVTGALTGGLSTAAGGMAKLGNSAGVTSGFNPGLAGALSGANVPGYNPSAFAPMYPGVS